MRRKQQEMQHLCNFNIQTGTGHWGRGTPLGVMLRAVGNTPCPAQLLFLIEIYVCLEGISVRITLFSPKPRCIIFKLRQIHGFFFFSTQETRLQLSKIQHSAKKSDLLTFYYLAS